MSRLKKSAGLAAAAVALIGGFEGLRTAAYLDPVGIPTICFGETRGVKIGDRKTAEECRAMLGPRIIEFEKEVRACLRNPDALPDGTYVATLSLAYNLGAPTFCKSSVRRNLDAGKIREACDAFRQFRKAGGIVWPGLVNRREAERAVCLKGAV